MARLKKATTRAIGSMIKRGSHERALRLGRIARRLNPEHDVTIGYDDAKALYDVKDPGGRIYVARRPRLKQYLWGIGARLDILRRDYMLDRVTIRPGDLALDCGANVGEVSMIWAADGADVISFEPDPLEFKALSANAGLLGSITPKQLALFNDTSEVSFYGANDTGDSSLFAANTGLPEIKVQAMCLDEVLADAAPDRPIRVMKIEAEGAEPEVLEGAEAALERCDYLTVDMGPERGLEALPTVPQVSNFLLARGFEMIGFRPGRCIGLFRATD